MNFKIPGLFYSKKHFIVSICLTLVLIIINTVEIVFASLNAWSNGFTTLVVISLVISIIGLFYSLKLPLFYAELMTNKKHDFSIISNYITKSLEQNISEKKKNYLRIILLRYLNIYDMPKAKELAKIIYFPENNEALELIYYKAFVEYYAVIGADKKFKETIDSMGRYKVPKALYNKYQLMYLLLIGDTLREEDIDSFEFSSFNLADNCLSLFVRGIYFKSIDDTKLLEKSIKALDGIYKDNSYSKILKGLTNEKENNN